MPHTPPVRPVLLLAGIGLLVGGFLAPPAAAQGAPGRCLDATGSVFASVKRFSGDPATNVLDGEAAGGGAAIGAALGDRWAVRLEVEMAGFTTHLQPHDVRVGTGKAATTVTIQQRVRNRPILVSALAGFRPAPHGRLQIQYLAGLTFVHLDRHTDTVAPPGTPAAVIPAPTNVKTYAPAATVGVDVELALTRHLLVVPAIRASTFNASGTPSTLLLRPGAGLRWLF